MNTYSSNGKLLLTAEYVVLDGAKALALPSKFGQTLEVNPNNSDIINWKSYNEKGELWFSAEFKLANKSVTIKAHTDQKVADRLVGIFNALNILNPTFYETIQGVDVATYQNFDRLWGLGTSSTLINNIANWTKVNAHELLGKTFGGSGYDIACAQYSSPITFQLKDAQKPVVNLADFKPTFSAHLYFVYLNQKQNSREGISAYKKLNRMDQFVIKDVTALTDAIVKCKTLSEFDQLIYSHESIISKLINQKPIKEKFFSDFNGEIKSLGAWGGDFILATSENDPTSYFKNKGFETIIPYKDMVH